LSNFDFGFDGDLLQILLSVATGQVRKFFGRALELIVEPFCSSVVFDDVGGPDEEESSSLGVYLNILNIQMNKLINKSIDKVLLTSGVSMVLVF